MKVILMFIGLGLMISGCSGGCVNRDDLVIVAPYSLCGIELDS